MQYLNTFNFDGKGTSKREQRNMFHFAEREYLRANFLRKDNDNYGIIVKFAPKINNS